MNARFERPNGKRVKLTQAVFSSRDLKTLRADRIEASLEKMFPYKKKRTK